MFILDNMPNWAYSHIKFYSYTKDDLEKMCDKINKQFKKNNGDGRISYLKALMYVKIYAPELYVSDEHYEKEWYKINNEWYGTKWTDECDEEDIYETEIDYRTKDKLYVIDISFETPWYFSFNNLRKVLDYDYPSVSAICTITEPGCEIWQLHYHVSKFIHSYRKIIGSVADGLYNDHLDFDSLEERCLLESEIRDELGLSDDDSGDAQEQVTTYWYEHDYHEELEDKHGEWCLKNENMIITTLRQHILPLRHAVKTIENYYLKAKYNPKTIIGNKFVNELYDENF